MNKFRNMWIKAGTMNGEERLIGDQKTPLLEQQRAEGNASKSHYQPRLVAKATTTTINDE
jgi:hypothetical protein